jgi:translation initiation factor 3 subunit C
MVTNMQQPGKFDDQRKKNRRLVSKPAPPTVQEKATVRFGGVSTTLQAWLDPADESGAVRFQKSFITKSHSDKSVRKKQENVTQVKQEGDDRTWETVPLAREKTLFPKDAEIHHAAVIEKMNEFLSGRDQRGKDFLFLSKQLEALRQISDLEKLGPALSLKLCFQSVICIFNYDVKVHACMKPEWWHLCQSKVSDLINILNSNQHVQLSETIADEEENVTNLDEPLIVKGSILVLLERLDDEFVRILQNTDAQSTDYVDRLTDERRVVQILDNGKAYVERTGTAEEVCRIYLRVIEHLYYKVDKYSLHPDDRANADATASDSKTKTAVESSRVQMDHLCKFIYSKDTTDRIRTRALLCNVYHLALHGHWYGARDLMLMSHLQESIQHSDAPTKVLYNRTIVQLGLCAFRKGLIKDAHNTLQDIYSCGIAGELLAQVLMSQKFTGLNPKQENFKKQRLIPFHMHINLELLGCVYLTCAMLLEIPNMAAHEFDYKKRMISKAFHYVLRVSERSPLVGPPESMREHVVAAATSMRTGDWQTCRDYMLDVKVWSLFLNPDKIKEMLTKRIQEESLRTYLFTYNSVYNSLSLKTLSEMFELPPQVVRRILSKMMISDELQGSWDEPTQSVTLHHVEPTRLQSLALQLAEKVGSLLENNERIMDKRYGRYLFKQGWQGQQQQQQTGQPALTVTGWRSMDKCRF